MHPDYVERGHNHPPTMAPPPQGQAPPPGNANNSSSNSAASAGTSNDKDENGSNKRALTAASLIDIIITNQINQTQVTQSSKYNGNILSKLEKSDTSDVVTSTAGQFKHFFLLLKYCIYYINFFMGRLYFKFFWKNFFCFT